MTEQSEDSALPEVAVEWAEPPPSKRDVQTAMQMFVAVLKENPGRWAKYPTGNAGAATALKLRYGCEAVTRRTATGVDVYVRYPTEQAS